MNNFLRRWRQLCAAAFLLAGLSVVGATQTVTYFHNDLSGSPVMATDAAGLLLWKENYRPYGSKYNNSASSNANSIGFAGRPHDASSGLSYMDARYYDPVLGRFLGVDPAALNTNSVHGLNRYTYANNNPVRYVDPDGHSPLDVAFLIWDLGKLGVAVYSGNPAALGEAAGDVALSVIGVASPIPFAGQAIKAARAAEHAVEAVRAAETAVEVGRAAKEKRATVPYKRPSGATTVAQRESVQGKPCVKCGAMTEKQIAGHKEALVKEHYETGTIDKQRMRSNDAVQTECPTCSAREGADMSRYSRDMKKGLGQ